MPTSEQADIPSEPSRSRLTGAVGSAWAATMGVLPHVLHHVGPLAGAALLAGTTGTLLFGAATFLLTIPLLLRVHRKSGTWRVPLALLGLFVAIWALSTFIVGPEVRDRLEERRDPKPEHQSEHEQHSKAEE